MNEYFDRICAAALLILVALAFFGALDFVVDSVKIFFKALQKYRQRNGWK